MTADDGGLLTTTLCAAKTGETRKKNSAIIKACLSLLLYMQIKTNDAVTVIDVFNFNNTTAAAGLA